MAATHDIEAEKAVLGSILLSPIQFNVVNSLIGPDDFYDIAHQTVFFAIRELRRTEQPIDVVLLKGLLEDKGQLEKAGGVMGIASLSEAAPIANRAEEYAKRVRETSLKRRLVHISRGIAEEAEADQTPHAAMRLIASAQRSISELSQGTVADVHSFHEVVEELMLLYRQLPGWATSLSDLHRVVTRFRGGELVVIAGRPGHGKTTLMRRFIRDLSDQGPVLVFSMEESARGFVSGLVCEDARLPRDYLADCLGTREEQDRLDQSALRLENLPIYVDGKPGRSAEEIASVAEVFHARNPNMSGIFIDYLQLLQGDPRESRHLQLAGFTRLFKLLGVTLNVPVFLASQISRESQRTTNKRPKLHELRDSGAIEADADVVLGVYRHSAYCDEEWADGLSEVLVLKQRITGKLGRAVIGFDGAFYDLAAANQSEKAEWYLHEIGD